MVKNNTKLLWIISIAGALLVLLAAFVLVLPKLINVEAAMGKVMAKFSEELGGEIEYQGLDLSFFPRPHAVVHRATLSIPGKGSVTTRSVKIYPKLLPFFLARVGLSKLQFEAPDVRVTLQEMPKTGTDWTGVFPSSDIGERARIVLGALASKAPGLTIEVENGELNLSGEENRTLFWFRDIDGRVGLPPRNLDIDITCTSNLWKRISLKGLLNSKDFKGAGRIGLTHFRPHLLKSHLFPVPTLQLADSQLNLVFGFKMDGAGVFQADLEGSPSNLTFLRANERLVLKAKSVKGSFRLDEKKATVVFKELNLDYPKLSAVGKLVIAQTSPQLSLELEGREIDVHSTRQAALALLGGIRTTQEIFGVIRGGKVPLINFDARGSSVAELGKLENILIRGRMLEGEIFVRKAQLDLQNVEGEAVVSKGILEGKNLAAQMGGSLGREGILKLGLEGENAPFHLDILIQADLVELPSVLKRLVKNKSFQEEAGLIEDFKGRATGRLVLGESTASIKPHVDVSKFNLSANYLRVPHPLKISGGHFSYDETGIDVENLSGKLGGSSFSEISGRFDWVKEPDFEVNSGKSEIFLGEIYPWLASFERLGIQPGNLRSVNGAVALSTLSLKGPLLRPENWHLQSMGELRHLVLHVALIPEVMEVRGGRFALIEDTIIQELSFRDAQITLLDASLSASGVLNDYLRGLKKVDVNIQGDMRSKSIRWVSNLIHMPDGLSLRSPISISQGRLVWDKGGGTSFNGNIIVQKGPRVSADVVWNPEELMIRELVIQDRESQASVALNVKERGLSLKFAGQLKKETIDRLFDAYRVPTGWVKGDFQAHILMDQPMRSEAQGKLTGQNIVFPYNLLAPLKIDTISLDAKKHNLQVESAAFTWGGKRMALEGNVKFSATELLLDMDLSTDGLDLADVEKHLKKDNKVKHGKKADDLWDLPVKGLIRLQSEYLKYEQFTWNPFHAEIRFADSGVSVAVTDANLCGISFPGVLHVIPQDLSLDFQPLAENQPLDETVSCLWDQEGRVTGNYDLKGQIMAQGQRKALAQSLQGDLSFSASNGRISRFGLLGKIYAFLKVTGIFEGEISDLKKEGFAYKSITANGNLQESKLVLNEAIIDIESMKIAVQGDIDFLDKKVDLKILLALLTPADVVINKIPVVRGITGGNLISIPIKVRGNLADPKITYLPLSEVGLGLLRVIARTLMLPVDMIRTILPKDKENQVAPEEQSDHIMKENLP